MLNLLFVMFGVVFIIDCFGLLFVFGVFIVGMFIFEMLFCY